ncbi:TonB-dependent receptor plug domain-containing protein [Duganella sp. FT80W]|uniref:TonB-dependent receptor plug domain-containing protein n=1 Tax=Duganella guangzhouensis TaxID=2666084 RepID=A0A6I2L0F8_9BURK|nr:TonB-dependent receptor [Duganella guangzhouensis]MRW90677.1 TonB-dependent receptor plug domain-containing protein [Duganella guangzhouensis]
MPKHLPRRTLYLHLLCALGASSLAHAAEPADANANGEAADSLQTVTVTAQKRAELARDVPAAISAFSGKDLREGGGNLSAGGVMDLVPNASGPTNDGHVRTRWWIRGIGTGDQSANVVSPVSFYVDEVYLNSPLLSGAPAYDLRQAEVLRGPQGTLWGKNTTGGAVSFITNKPTFKPDGYFKAELGNHNSHIVEAAAGGALQEDVLAGRISLYSDSTDGYGRNTFQHSKTGKKEEDHQVRVQLLANLSPDLQALFNVHGRDYHGTGDALQGLGLGAGGTNTYGYVLPPLGTADIATNAPTSDDLRGSGASLTLHWNLGRNELTSITSYERVARTTNGDGDATPLEISRSHADISARQSAQELRLASPRSDQLNWIVGAHYFTEKLDNNNSSGNLPGVQTIATPTGTIPTAYNNLSLQQDTKSYALFGSLTYNFSERFNLTGGLRWTSESKDIALSRVANSGTVSYNNTAEWWKRSSVSSTLLTTATQNADTTWKAATWDLTPQYKFSQDVSAYARAAKGFRGGGYNGGVTTQSTVAVVSPEYLTSGEAGLRTAWLDHRVTADVTAFYYDYKNVQLNQVVSTSTGPVSRLTNGAKAKAHGAEFELAAQATQALRLNAAIGLLRSKYTDYGAYTGNEFGRAPHTNVLVGGEYRQPLNNGGEAVFSTNWNYRSRYFFVTTNETDPNYIQPAYTIGNLKLSYLPPGKKVNLTFYVNNLTNRFYKTNAIPYGNNVIGYSNSDPRTFGVSATYRW